MQTQGWARDSRRVTGIQDQSQYTKQLFDIRDWLRTADKQGPELSKRFVKVNDSGLMKIVRSGTRVV
jgi:hypothetical protein